MIAVPDFDVHYDHADVRRYVSCLGFTHNLPIITNITLCNNTVIYVLIFCS